MCVPKDECKDDTVEDQPKQPSGNETNCGPEQVCCFHLIVRTEKTIERHSYYYRDAKAEGGPAVTKLGDFPWQAVLFTQDEDFLCSGVLVSTKHLLTTADCAAAFQDSGAPTLKVRLGVVDRETTTPSQKDFTVQKVTLHPGFQPPSKENNLAVLEVSNEVVYDNHILRISLAESEASFEGDKCTLSGWGKHLKRGSLSTTLLQVNVSILDTTTCEDVLQKSSSGSSFKVPEGSFCVAGSCQGDEGGPVMCRGPTQFVLAGVVSYGDLPCGEQPGVYAYIPKNLDFISQATGLRREDLTRPL
uniref:Putative trypsin-like serine protease n=1 Tax=Ornithodoros turicata TaxID=34597 RepID=A0A2R5LI71_9ACAR